MGYDRRLDIVMTDDLAERFFRDFNEPGKGGDDPAKAELFGCELERKPGFAWLHFDWEKNAGAETDDWFANLKESDAKSYIRQECNEYDEVITDGKLYVNPFEIEPEVRFGCPDAKTGLERAKKQLVDIFGKESFDAALKEFAAESARQAPKGPKA